MAILYIAKCPASNVNTGRLFFKTKINFSTNAKELFMDYRKKVILFFVFVLLMAIMIITLFIEIPLAILGVVIGFFMNRHPKIMLWFFGRKLFNLWSNLGDSVFSKMAKNN
jgi:hypothetical protein